MGAYLSVAFGSAIGGMARYGFGNLVTRLLGPEFPWGTIMINVIGSFVIAFFGTLTLSGGPFEAGPNLRIFVMVGFCGGFTTFSSFSLQTLDLVLGGQWLSAIANILLSVVLCLLAVTAGHLAAGRLFIT